MATVIKINSKDLIYALNKKNGKVFFADTSNDVGSISKNGMIIHYYLTDIIDNDHLVYFINSNKYKTSWEILIDKNKIPDIIKNI